MSYGHDRERKVRDLLLNEDWWACFWAKATVRDDGCWVWTASVDANGYGKIWSPRPGRVLMGAHRLAWQFHHGYIGPDLVVDHLCENKNCVNPDHLEAVPFQVNVIRGAGAQTTCRHGHLLDGLRRDRQEDGTVCTRRYCRHCGKARKDRLREEAINV
jgi:hypothetical protein